MSSIVERRVANLSRLPLDFLFSCPLRIRRLRMSVHKVELRVEYLAKRSPTTFDNTSNNTSVNHFLSTILTFIKFDSTTLDNARQCSASSNALNISLRKRVELCRVRTGTPTLGGGQGGSCPSYPFQGFNYFSAKVFIIYPQ